MKYLKQLTIFAMVAAMFASCDDDDDDTTPPPDNNGNLMMSINGLEDLGPDYVYEGWLIVDGNPISTGTFTVNEDGSLSQTSFQVDNGNLTTATKFVLSIEPAIDPDPAPSEQKLIASDFSGDMAAVSVDVAPAVGDFSNASGTYFLRTPTDEMPGTSNNGNDMYGVWFGNPGMPPTSGLTLPDLGEGWTYEGWVVTENGPLSTGTFDSFDERDSGNPYSGTENNMGPPIPGEDFFIAPAGAEDDFPIDMRGKTVVISVEPVPDNSPAPFVLKPLAAMVDGNADTAPNTHSFGQNLESFPSGTVTR